MLIEKQLVDVTKKTYGLAIGRKCLSLVCRVEGISTNQEQVLQAQEDIQS